MTGKYNRYSWFHNAQRYIAMTLVHVTILLLIPLLSCTKSAAATTIKWRVHQITPKYIQRSIYLFQGKVDRATVGRLQISRDEQKSDGNAAQDLQALSEGKIQMLQVSLEDLAAYWPEARNLFALELPFVIKDPQHAVRIMEAGSEFLQPLHEIGIKGIAFAFAGGPRLVMSLNDKVTKFSDLKKLRCSYSGHKYTLQTYKEFGLTEARSPLRKGDPQRESLREGLADIAIMTQEELMDVWNGNGGKIIPKHVFLSQHQYPMSVILMNEKLFNSLPEAMQDVLIKAGRHVAREELSEFGNLSGSLDKSLRDRKIEVASPNAAELIKARRLVAPMLKKFKQDVPGGDRILALIKSQEL
jgi:TRAP-type transport system periplasmic protein